ncbi:MAG: primosomal protein N' [Cetobacterium sp.]|uniref:replication restart helicase PriA n=1 Tax=unclassified Cetobacterium TaxID=2630983 RepID=UPI00163D3C3E|nr:primosomal protein N' [Cetobacterium sp. 2A]MBC2855821.1 primosomal protein N' [Cetobacterium sp. 2A]
MKYWKVYLEGTNNFFTYSAENEEAKIGDRVLVSFRNRDKVGVVIEEDLTENFEFKVLPIKKVMDEQISFDEKFIKLLLWIKDYYMCSFEQIFNTAVPAGMNISYKSIYYLNPEKEISEKNEIHKYLEKKKSISKVTLEKHFPKKSIDEMVKMGDLILEKKIKDFEENKFLKEIGNYKEVKDAILNTEQSNVKNGIINSKSRHFLIRGVTGSGKTEVYIQLIKEALKTGGGSIFLVPEISLTPQMIKRFKDEFNDSVAILHSKLTNSERAKEWYSLYSGQKRIVLGVRSAIFAPVKNLEYIIIDEEHENSYKQDSSPRYNAKYVAIKRAEIEGAKVVLGSATPSIESYYYGKKGIFELYTMEHRYNDAKLPEMKVVDMKAEEDQFFSKELLEKIKMTLLKKEQVILLLNRKGYSTLIQCKECGHMEECEHCSIKMNYYFSNSTLKCNYCGVTKKFSKKCSKCGSTNLTHSGKGVERVEEELKKYFPVNIVRVDGDISKEKGFYENMYHDFLNGKYDIMIGTQMIAKGLHFPNVTLVGVINSDTILTIPDFRSGERTFQMVTQVAGRAGRGEKKGEVIIQTYQPESYVIEKILENDYESFYNQEIENRELLEYPPFSKIINIGISSKKEEGLEKFAQELCNEIKSEKVEIYGPMKSLVYKVKDRYRYNIFIKGSRTEINKYKNLLKKKLENFENKDFRVTVDIDPINLI